MAHVFFNGGTLEIRLSQSNTDYICSNEEGTLVYYNSFEPETQTTKELYGSKPHETGFSVLGWASKQLVRESSMKDVPGRPCSMFLKERVTRIDRANDVALKSRPSQDANDPQNSDICLGSGISNLSLFTFYHFYDGCSSQDI